MAKNASRCSTSVAESLSHIDEHGQPTMVDVGAKAVTLRSALAEATVRLPAEVATILRQAGFVTAKGPVFATAIVAGTLAAKRTHELIPFCHPLALERCELRCDCGDDDVIRITCRVALHGRTGVEMEALTGASVAALTVYDMCKALSHELVIGEVRLLEKTGGKADFTRTPEAG
ncbi:MAG: cyclic pyranopterin monophosphate synthase MoaC [Steroidobacteraceae bacterium]